MRIRDQFFLPTPVNGYVTDFPLCNRFLVSGYRGIKGERGEGGSVYFVERVPLHSSVGGWDSITVSQYPKPKTSG